MSCDEEQFEHDLNASNQSLFESADAYNNIELEADGGEQDDNENDVKLEVNKDENEIIEDRKDVESNQVNAEIDNDLCTICFKDIMEDKSRQSCD